MLFGVLASQAMYRTSLVDSYSAEGPSDFRALPASMTQMLTLEEEVDHEIDHDLSPLPASLVKLSYKIKKRKKSMIPKYFLSIWKPPQIS